MWVDLGDSFQVDHREVGLHCESHVVPWVISIGPQVAGFLRWFYNKSISLY